MKSFKKLKSVIVNNLNAKDFFMSDIFRQHLSGIVKMVSERYGNERMSVRTVWGGNDIAYTDNRLVFINLNNAIIKGIDDIETRYLCSLGFLGHELGHVLYTDFDSFESVALGKTGKYIGLDEKGCKIADEISNYRNKGFNDPITEIYHYIQNSVEDGFVNRKISVQFPGTFKEGISFLHSISYKDSCSTGKRVDDILNTILSVSLGMPVPDDVKSFIGTDCFNQITKIFSGFEKVETPDERIGITNNLFVMLWPEIKPMLDNTFDKNNKQGENQQGESNNSASGSESANGANGSSSGSQKDSGNSSGGSLSDMLNNLKASSQMGKGKGILNSRNKNSSGKNGNKPETKNEKGKGSSAPKSNETGSGTPGDKEKDSLSAGNMSTSSSNKDKSTSDNMSSDEGGSDSNDKTSDAKNSTAGNDENENKLSENPDSNENGSDNKNSSEHNSNSESDADASEDAQEDTNSSENCDGNNKNPSENGLQKDNRADDDSNDSGKASEENSGFEDMSETPVDSDLSYSDDDSKDIKSAIEGLLSQYAKQKINNNPEAVEEIVLQQNAVEISSDRMSEHYGYPFKVNNISGVNNRCQYDLAAKTLLGISKRLTKRVEQVLEDQNDGGVCKNLLKGNKVNPAAAASSNGRVFKRNILPESKDIAISLLIDESGSMSGTRIEKALEMAILVEYFCRELNIPLSVVGHSDSGGEVRLNNYIRFEDVNPKRKYNLTQMRAGGCNRDGFALKYCIKNLLERDEENKLMIIISDGRPNSRNYSGASAENDLKAIKKELERKGGRLIAAAIGDDRDTIKRIYGNSFLDVTDINNLPLKMASIISKYVQD